LNANDRKISQTKPVACQWIARYVTATDKALKKLGLKATVDLSTGIKKTLAWYQQRLTQTDNH